MCSVSLFLLICVAVVDCTTLYVNSNSGVDEGACRNPAAPCKSLEYVVGEGVSGDTILAAGAFVSNFPLKLIIPLSVLRMPGSKQFSVTCGASASNAIQITSSDVKIVGADFRSCSASAVSVTLASTGVSLSNVTCDGLGGAVSVSASSAVTVEHAYVTGLRSDGIVCHSGSLHVLDTTISQNIPDVMQGVGLRVTGGCKATLHKIVLLNLVSKLDGAAILVNQESSVVGSGVSVSGCKSESNGGAVAVIEASFFNITQADLRYNDAAGGGGAVYASSSSVVHIGDALIELNSATVGGAVFLENLVELRFHDTMLNENTAQTAGGAIYMQPVLEQSPKVTLDTVTISANDVGAGGTGGSFSCVGGSLEGFQVVLRNNTVVSQGQGAAGYLGPGCVMSFTDFFVGSNTFEGGGLEGVICLNGGQADVSGATLGDEAVICEPGCNLAVNGDQNVCASQPRGPASPKQSLIDDVNTIEVQVNTAATVPIVARDFYNRKLNTLVDLNWKGIIKTAAGLTLSNVPPIHNSAPGEYKATFTIGTVGNFFLLIQLDEAEIRGSPHPVKVKNSSVSPPTNPNLTALWVVLALVATGGIVIVTILGYKKFAKRGEYKPLADNNAAMGFESSTDME